MRAWFIACVAAFWVIGVGAAREAQRPGEGPAKAGRHEQAAGPREHVAGRLEHALSPRNANYSITARLDPRTRLLTGQQVLTWRNISRATATDLRFHLYFNAWRDTRSTWMRERRLALGDLGLVRPAEDWGSIDVTAVRLLGVGGAPPLDLTPHKRYIAPDDGNADDRTVLSVPLPSPAAPGHTLNVQIEWTSRVPRTVARTGAIGQYFFLAQWFPKVGVLEDAGWNCHQFHASTEFFSDYGVYDVRLTVPTGWVVGATGTPAERRDQGDGTTTHRYRQDDVHDFAWTTSPDYLERRAKFTHASLPPVDMRLLLQPEHAGQAERHFAATRAALKYYGEWYGAYPYSHITIVDPAWQSGAGGMEYPTLFTAGSRWLAPRRVMQPESVTVHEAGHQFWYGVVANNEFEHAWLDEGLNTFSTARAIAQAFGANYQSERYFGGFIPWVFRDLPVVRETDGNRRAGYRLAARADAPSALSFRYHPSTGPAITYNKTALWLNTLERHLGWPVLQRILSTFYTRWRFRHPKPDDFFAVANEVSGRDLTWFFDQTHRSSNVFDYAVDTLFSEPAGGDGRFMTQVVARRHGEAIFPVDLLVTFENGERVRERWDGRERWKLFTYERASKARSAQVDPDRVLLLDVNFTNNSRTLQPRSAEAATKWSLKWLVWLQDLLVTYSALI